MTAGEPGTGAPGEPITVTDNRVVDPETGEVRTPDGAATGDAPLADAAAAEAAASAEAAQVAELTEALQRERAQFSNFRRRSADEKQQSVSFGKQVLIEKLLPVLDDLERAREHGHLEDGPLRAFADKLLGILGGEGVARFGDSGDAFDPELHEAIQNDGSGEDPVLGLVYRSGYRLGDRVIRNAMVTVTDPADPAGPAGSGGQ